MNDVLFRKIYFEIYLQFHELLAVINSCKTMHLGSFFQ